MKITKDAVVAFEYTLTNDAGEVLDSSDGEPLTYMHGHGQLVPGLESALEGKTGGQDLQVVVEPKLGYGEKGSGKVVHIPADELPSDDPPEIGMALEAVGPNGESELWWVIETNDEGISISPDHPLAGVTLHFDVSIKEVRAASKEELAHGHVHGPDGHHH
jgi:FKBP-type peptidyl-prolyl cis-trans isomerase SlyD